MGELGGFLKIERHGVQYRDPSERVKDYKEFLVAKSAEEIGEQGARCMECGIPFCHNGCPLGNLIPDWNDLVYRDRWFDAIRQLHATNNFPEFTGRLCPAPCEAACVLEIREGDAVTIKQIENSIIDRAWEEGWVAPDAAVGRDRASRSPSSAPARPGMAAAQQLRREGHRVVLFERDEAGGGLVRFGVPDFKIEKWVVERRVQQLRDEGVDVRCGVDVGVDVTVEELRSEFDAVVLCTGSRVPRDLPVPGRELDGIHYAMDYLYGRNRWVADGVVRAADHRRGQARRRHRRRRHRRGLRRELRPRGRAVDHPARAAARAAAAPARRPHAVAAVAAEVPPLLRDGGGAGARQGRAGLLRRDDALQRRRTARVKALHAARTNPEDPFGPPLEGTEFEIKADLVLLAMGFLHPEPALLDGLGVEKDRRGNAKAPTYETSVPGVFAAGDARRGQSLIVWAINEGRQAARMVERYLGTLDAEDMIHSGNVEPADSGPAGPPQGRARYGVAAEER